MRISVFSSRCSLTTARSSCGIARSDSVQVRVVTLLCVPMNLEAAAACQRHKSAFTLPLSKAAAA